MITKTIVNHLSSCLEVPVYAEMPEESLTQCVIIDITGGSTIGRGVYMSKVAIQCYEETRAEAETLAETVRDAMEGIVELDSVSSCRVNAGPYNFPDVTNRKYRFQIVYEIVHY